MTQEEKKKAKAADKWLSRYRAALVECRTCKRQLVRLRSMARSIGSPDSEQTRIISGRASDVTQAAAIAIAEAADDLHSRIRDAMLVRREIEQAIRHIRDDRDRALIELRYIECRSYASIADEMDYSDASNARRRIWRALGRMQLPVA